MKKNKNNNIHIYQHSVFEHVESGLYPSLHRHTGVNVHTIVEDSPWLSVFEVS